jgi:hypothetical protein
MSSDSITEETLKKKKKLLNINSLKWAYINNCLNGPLIWSKAIEEENIKILEWAKNERISWALDKLPFDEICKNDNIVVLDWIFNNEPALYNKLVDPYKPGFYISIGKNGAINIMHWLENKIKKITFSNTIIIVQEAAKYGHLNIVKWILSNYTTSESQQKNICYNALKSSNIDLIKYLFDNNYAFDKETTMSCVCSQSKNFDLIKYVYNKNSCHWQTAGYPDILDSIIRNFRKDPNFFEILHWAIDTGCPYSGYECLLAAKNNDIQLLKLLLSLKNIPIHFMCGFNLSGFAAYHGEFELIKWLKENLSKKELKREFNKSTTLMAAQGLQIYILNWLIKEGCEYNKRNCYNAIRDNSETTTTSIEISYKPVFVIDNIEPFVIPTY